MGYNNRKEESRGNVNSIKWRQRPNFNKRKVSRLTPKELTRSFKVEPNNNKTSVDMKKRKYKETSSIRNNMLQ